TIQVEQERLEGWKTRWRIEQSLPPHPALSPGERENMRTPRQGSGNVDFDPTHRSSTPGQPDHDLHDRTPWRTRPFQMSRVVLPLPKGEGGVRGKGLACRSRLSFQPLAPVSIPPKMARNLCRPRHQPSSITFASGPALHIRYRTSTPSGAY